MKIVRKSEFKNAQQDHVWYVNWCKAVGGFTGRNYDKIEVLSLLGKTTVWHCGKKENQPLVIFPGFRTSALFWDLDKGLDYLVERYSVFLVETNGQPNDSNGETPAIRSRDYGIWAADLLNKLEIEKAYIAGASFGGIVCMKLAIISPEKVKAIFLLNPGCFQFFSLKWKNIISNLRPLFFPSEKNVRRFLDESVFCKPEHRLTDEAEKLIVEYELYALKNYRDKTQKPYAMKGEMDHCITPAYLLLGDADRLFPYQSQIKNAKKMLPSLKDVIVFKDVSHGIETYRKALQKMAEIIQEC